MRRLVGLLTAFVVLASPAYGAQPTTTLADLSSTGTQANAAASYPTISANGRYVAFVSSATNLVSADAMGNQSAYLRDRKTLSTVRLNDPAQSGYYPLVSADGTAVDYLSHDAGGYRWFHYDIASGSSSPLPGPTALGGSCNQPVPTYTAAIDAGGDKLAYCAAGDIYLTSAAGATLVTQLPGGTALNGSSFDATISGDGNWVGFTTNATNWETPADTDGFRDVLLWHATDGSFTNASVANGGGNENLHSSSPAIDQDGCVTAFYSDATNLVQGDAGTMNKTFVRDRCGNQTEFGSLDNSAMPTTGKPPLSISSDGCRIGYTTSAGAASVRDRCDGATQRADVSTQGDAGNGNATQTILSPGAGRYVAVASQATNLVSSDANGTASDVFVRDTAIDAPPLAALTLTQNGDDVTADATASNDPDGYVLTASTSFGDGSDPQPGLQGTHTYTRGGTFTVSVTVTDADGVSSTKALPVSVPTPGAVALPPLSTSAVPPPVLSPPMVAPVRLTLDKVSLSRRRFPLRGKGKGAQLTLRLSAPATVTLTFSNARKVKGRTRYAKGRVVTKSLPAGTSTIAIGSGLKPGKHRVSVAASAGGTTATSKTLAFTTTKGKK